MPASRTKSELIATGGDGMDDAAFESADLHPDVDAVVVGWDKDFSMRKLCLASLYLQGGAEFVVTNPDSADRMAGDRMQAALDAFPYCECVCVCVRYSQST